MDLVDHRQPEPALVADVGQRRCRVNGAAEARVFVALAHSRQTGVFVEQPSESSMNVEKI